MGGNFEWIFVVDPLDGPDDERIDRMYDVIDGTVGSHGGLTIITVTAPGLTAAGAGLSAAAVLSDSGFVVARSHPDLVTRSDISERADVSRQAVTNWVNGARHRSEPFPAPVYAVSGGVWLWGDVSAWLAQNLGKDVTDGLNYPTIADHIVVDTLLVEETAGGGSTPLVPAAALGSLTAARPAQRDWRRLLAADTPDQGSSSFGSPDAGVPQVAAAFGDSSRMSRQIVESGQILDQARVATVWFTYGNNVEIPDHFPNYVSQKLVQLKQFYPNFFEFRVELNHTPNPRQRKSDPRIEIWAFGRGPVVHVEARADSFYAALESAVDKLESVLRRVEGPHLTATQATNHGQPTAGKH